MELLNSQSCTDTREAHDMPRLQLKEINILIEFYHETNGHEWTNHQGWLEDITTEDKRRGAVSWFGTTWRDGHLVSLQLESNALAGRLPPSLRKLRYLEILKLRNNDELTGKIPPSMYHRSNNSLQYVYLSGTKVCSGIDDTTCSRLQVIQYQEAGVATVNFQSLQGARWILDMTGIHS